MSGKPIVERVIPAAKARPRCRCAQRARLDPGSSLRSIRDHIATFCRFQPALRSRPVVPARQEPPGKAAFRTEYHREQIDHADGEDDGRPAGAAKMIGEQQAGHAAEERDQGRDADGGRDVLASRIARRSPAASSCRRPEACRGHGNRRRGSARRGPRKRICVGPPARLTERRKFGSTHSSTSGR